MNNFRSFSLLFLVLLSLAADAQQQAPKISADLIVLNGKILTLDDKSTVAEALAVRDGKIVAVGKNAEILKFADAQTRRVDLAGRTMMPGLIDTHTHALAWAQSVVRNELDLSYPKTAKVADVVGALKIRAAQTQPNQWIVGTSWDDAKLAEKRYLTREDLDAVSPANPVYLEHVSGHLAVVNSVALQLAGIDAKTPNPQGGVIERDAEGNPTGILKDTAMTLAIRLLPADSEENSIKAVAYLSNAAAEVGLTTIHDIALMPSAFAAYQKARQQNLLKIRVEMSPLVSRSADVERIRAMGIQTGFGDDLLKFGPIKIFADGGMGARTIAVYPPAAIGEKADNLGLLIWKTEDLEKTQQQLAALGWQLATHAIGDRAIDQVLDSYQKIKAQYPNKDLRNRVIHCGIATPAIQKRLKDLNVLVDDNPPFVYWIGSWFEKYGAERVRWAYPAKSYFDNGIIASGGSDVNVTPISPWWGIWAAVVRREIKTGQILAPEERVTVRQALQMYTRNGAYAGFDEKTRGSLETGKYADFIVLDRNPLEIPSDELKDVKVLATFVGGNEIVDKLAEKQK